MLHTCFKTATSQTVNLCTIVCCSKTVNLPINKAVQEKQKTWRLAQLFYVLDFPAVDINGQKLSRLKTFSNMLARISLPPFCYNYRIYTGQPERK